MRSKKIFTPEKIETHKEVNSDDLIENDNKTKMVLFIEKRLIEKAKASGDWYEMQKIHTQHPQRAGLDLDHLLFPQ